MGMVMATGEETSPTETLCATASSLALAQTAVGSPGFGLALWRAWGREPHGAEATHPAQPPAASPARGL